MSAREHATSAGDGRLLRLSEAVSDGSSVDWDAELRDTPRLTSELKRQQQLEAIGKLHSSLGTQEFGLQTLAVRSERCLFRFGPLEVRELVGRGSFGEVYRALDTRLRCEVALKLRRMDRVHVSRAVAESRAHGGHLAFDLPREETVSVTLYDAAGRAVAHPLAAERLPAGRVTRTWRPVGLPRGTYMLNAGRRAGRVAHPGLARRQVLSFVRRLSVAHPTSPSAFNRRNAGGEGQKRSPDRARSRKTSRGKTSIPSAVSSRRLPR